MTEAKGVEAVERALQILDCFTHEDTELPLAELAKRSGFYKSTIMRLAVSLEKFGYLRRGESGRYRLGPTIWRLGALYQRALGLEDIIRPELKRLSDATNETASYFVRDGDSRICLFRCEPMRAMRHAMLEGERLPLTIASSGKILLAYSAPATPEGLAVREAGYAISHGERDPEVASMAMPVLASDGRIMGALAVSGLVTHFNDEHQLALLAALADVRDRLAHTIAP